MKKIFIITVLLLMTMMYVQAAEPEPAPDGYEWANIALGLGDDALVSTDGKVHEGYNAEYMFDGARLPNMGVSPAPKRFVLTKGAGGEAYSYFTIDLGEIYTVGGINYCYPGVYDNGKYKIFISDNNKDFIEAASFSYGTGSGETGMIPFSPQKCRYIKISRDSTVYSDQISCYELEIFGLVDSVLCRPKR